MKKIFITGIAGFVGSYLADLLLTKKGVTVCGIDYPGADTKNIDHIKNRFKLYQECDIKIKQDIKDMLGKTKPDCIVHLAAQSSPLLSEQYPEDTIATNIAGQVNIFEALSALRIKLKIIIAGSCDEYGPVAKKEMPIKEDYKLAPGNLYALTKVTQELLGLNFYNKQGHDIIVTRPFHTTGPRRPERFVCSNLAKQIALIEKHRQKPIISVGNMSIIRDFTDVRDVANAYWLIIKKGKPGEAYNICSGKECFIKEVFGMLLSLTKVKVKVKADKMRSNDVSMLVGDYHKLKKATGWQPKIPIEQTLKDLLDYWREQA